MQNSLARAAKDETGGTGNCIYAAGQGSVALDHWKKPSCGKTVRFWFEISNKKVSNNANTKADQL